MKRLFALRVMLTGIALYFVYHETGPATVLVLSAVVMALELTSYTLDRLIDAVKLLSETWITESGHKPMATKNEDLENVSKKRF